MSARLSGAATAVGPHVATPVVSRASDGTETPASSARQQHFRSDNRRESGNHSFRAVTSVGLQRPSACPILTPQFHWNLNAHAVESLSELELAQVYQLFRFYDSSTVGDTLPSINCRRFLQVLHDARLIAPSASGSRSMALTTPCYESVEEEDDNNEQINTNDDAERLQLAAVEKLFAEAVLGKLRTRLDTDAQPVLTFHLFCGALLNCATTVYPALRAQPAVAFSKLLDRLLTSADRYADDRRQETQRHVQTGSLDPRHSEEQQRSRQGSSRGRQMRPSQAQQSGSAGQRQRLSLIEPQVRCSSDQDQQQQQCQSQRPQSSMALLQHFPFEGTDTLWYPHEANGAMVTQTLSHISGYSNDSGSTCVDSASSTSSSNMASLGPINFRSLKPYQQVLATFSLDITSETRARERSQQQYAIPPALAAHFSADHLRLVVERFRLFDVFDRGSLPRQEILPLLTALVKKLEIPDMYDVLTLLLTGERAARGDKSSAAATLSSDSTSHSSLCGNAEISLHEVLHAIYTCRRSRTSSSYGYGSNNNAIDSHEASLRRAGVAKAAGGTGSSAVTGGLERDAALSASETTAEQDHRHSDADSGSASRKGTASGKKSTLKTKGNANKAAATASKRSVTSDSMTQQQQHKHSVLLKDAVTLDGLKTFENGAAATAAPALPRRASRRKSKQPIGSDSARAASDEVVVITPEAVSTITDTQSEKPSLTQSDAMSKSRTKSSRGSTTAAGASLDTGDRLVVQMPTSRLEPVEKASSSDIETVAPSPNAPSNRSVKRVRVFMLLGGEHDGAICYSIELALLERRLDESRGIYFLNASHQVLKRAQVLPVQPDNESALLMMNKRVQQRQREGFVLHPPEQMDAIDNMLLRIHQRSPHYRSALGSDHRAATRQPPSDERSSGNDVIKMTSVRCSLDQSPTRVRQRSASDLRIALSDVRLNESLKATKRAVVAMDSSGVSRCRNQRAIQRGVNSGMIPQTPDMVDAIRRAAPSLDDLSWIHAVNDAAHWRQPCAQTEILHTSASAPLLPVSPTKKPHHRKGSIRLTPSAHLLPKSSQV